MADLRSCSCSYRDWSHGAGRPRGEAYTEDEARRRYAAGEGMTVLVGDLAAPRIVVKVELGGDLVEVGWLDHLQRTTTSYLWTRRPDDPGWPGEELLLERMRISRYDHDQRLPQGRATWDEVYDMRADGSFHTSASSPGGHDRESGSGKDPEVVRTLEVPAFGAWEPFLHLVT